MNDIEEHSFAYWCVTDSMRSAAQNKSKDLKMLYRVFAASHAGALQFWIWNDYRKLVK